MMAPARYTAQELRLLQLLSVRFPTITAAHIEMINLNAILVLPKGTNHYISDIHGAYAQFDHILRHASGAIRRKVAQTFAGELTDAEQVVLAMLIYYPQQKLHAVLAAHEAPTAWMAQTIAQLARVARTTGQKYTRSKVRKRLPPQLAYILEELLTESQIEHAQKERYYGSIVQAIVDLGEAETIIVTLAELVHTLVVDRLFILGDIYDRGPAAERVMDRLMAFHTVAILWGNHDIAWMGAASGCDALLANVVRIALRYANIETLVDGYGISLRSLARFAAATYGDDPCAMFQPKAGPPVEDYSRTTLARMHKVITIIQLKLEAQIIRRHPEYAMDDRLLLDQIDLDTGTVLLEGTRHPLRDTYWPTLDRADRAALTDDEAAVMAELRAQFLGSTRLQEHMRFLYSRGGMFRLQDGNLLFHGCLPVDERGAFVTVALGGELLAGPALLERYEQLAREAFFSHDRQARTNGQDALWYLWCGPQSPLFGRARMTTFERYFIADKATHAEAKGPYYAMRKREDFCRMVLAAFGGDAERGCIINGHTPVKVRKGERPLLANGRLIVIDGGMSEAYQSVTGIAGYTLIGNSHELVLAAHAPFAETDELLRQGRDVTPQTEQVVAFPHRLLIADTDTGQLLREQLDDLRKLIDAYRRGILPEAAQEALVRRS
jgi:fructose-1,6-bisphosphatase-3